MIRELSDFLHSIKNALRIPAVRMLFFAVIALLALYWPFLSKLVIDWGENPDYSHGYFIPFISIFMIYFQREKLAATDIKTSWWGFTLLMLGLVLLVVAKIGSEYFTQRVSFIFCLGGLCWLFLGGKMMRLLLIPLGYLIFMVPLPAIIWNKLAFPLQLFGSALTEQVVRLLGIPIYREGNVLYLVETTLEVVAACSGLRSLMTMFAMATLLAFISSLPFWKKIILFISAAPVAIIANMIRLSSTALLASFYGEKIAQGFLHEASGMVVFFMGLGMLYLIYIFLQRGNTKGKKAGKSV